MDQVPGRPAPPESDSDDSPDEAAAPPNVNREAAVRRAASPGQVEGAAAQPKRRDGAPPVAKLPVQIRTLDGKTFKIHDCKENWTVAQLRDEFMKWYGEGGDRIVFHYKAKRLNDNDPLAKYKIEPRTYLLNFPILKYLI